MYIFQNFQAIFTKKNLVSPKPKLNILNKMAHGSWGGGESQATIQEELADHENEMEMLWKIIQSQRG